MSNGTVKTAELRVLLPEKSMTRLETMQSLAGCTLQEVVSDAFRIYEEILKRATESEDAGGIVYLTVKRPDGTIISDVPVLEAKLDS